MMMMVVVVVMYNCGACTQACMHVLWRMYAYAGPSTYTSGTARIFRLFGKTYQWALSYPYDTWPPHKIVTNRLGFQIKLFIQIFFFLFEYS
jgi:hypothetical protein